MNTKLPSDKCAFAVVDAKIADYMKILREQFPAIHNNTGTVFFDNAATTQKPRQVIEAMRSYYEESCANANRAAYSLSSKLHHRVEQTRKTIAKFINAQAADIAFTSGATDSLNLVALTWGLHNLDDGDQIMLCLEDHRSAVLPWLNLKSQLSLFGKNIEIVPFTMHYSGMYDRASLYRGISERTRLIAMSHIHHLYGLEWDAKDLAEIKALLPIGALISFDASQSVGHTVVDVEELEVDFVSFSGHKIFAANGTGVLWVNPKLKNRLYPVRIGSKSAVETIEGGIEINKATLAGILECGTLNLPGIYSLGSAVEFIESVGMSKIAAHLSSLTYNLYDKLKTIPTIEFAPGLNHYDCAKGLGIISFKFCGISSSDIAQYLDANKIQVRSGDYCLVSKQAAEKDYIRVSLHLYNTAEEINLFIELLKQII